LKAKGIRYMLLITSGFAETGIEVCVCRRNSWPWRQEGLILG
jgi:hypothetical protein